MFCSNKRPKTRKIFRFLLKWEKKSSFCQVAKSGYQRSHLRFMMFFSFKCKKHETSFMLIKQGPLSQDKHLPLLKILWRHLWCWTAKNKQTYWARWFSEGKRDAVTYLAVELVEGGKVTEPVVQELDGLAELGRLVLQHVQLGRLVQRGQDEPLGVPVELKNEKKLLLAPVRGWVNRGCCLVTSVDLSPAWYQMSSHKLSRLLNDFSAFCGLKVWTAMAFGQQRWNLDQYRSVSIFVGFWEDGLTFGQCSM